MPNMATSYNKNTDRPAAKGPENTTGHHLPVRRNKLLQKFHRARTHQRLRGAEALHRTHDARRAEYPVAYPHTALCQIVGHDQRQEQVHPRERRGAALLPLSGRSRLRGPLSASQPQKPLLLGQRAHTGRQPGTESFGQAYCGDLSAILIQNISPLVNLIRVPSKRLPS